MEKSRELQIKTAWLIIISLFMAFLVLCQISAIAQDIDQYAADENLRVFVSIEKDTVDYAVLTVWCYDVEEVLNDEDLSLSISKDSDYEYTYDFDGATTKNEIVLGLDKEQVDEIMKKGISYVRIKEEYFHFPDYENVHLVKEARRLFE